MLRSGSSAKTRDELAAVIVEPINGQCGMVPSNPDFLEGVRRITSELGILLKFDEGDSVSSFARRGPRVLRGDA